MSNCAHDSITHSIQPEYFNKKMGAFYVSYI